ncbi:hypothetical protein AKO1_011783 [Acrasis kona]|uniref:Pre-rRNA-processing protein Ipi1 N-terminal domain-containing protein n=1 Tax=Acrasis kona TaxID=1008807 RepID=A0AAW2Z6S5_9EUKA
MLDGEYVTTRNLSLNDLVGQLRHYNVSVAKDAVRGVKELLTLHPIILRSGLNKVMKEILPCMMDYDLGVRTELQSLLEYIFTETPTNLMSPFIALTMAFISTGLTHFVPDIRRTAMGCLESLITNLPFDSAQFSNKVLPNLINVFTLSRAGNANKGIKYRTTQEQIVRLLDQYLGVLFYYNKLHIPIQEAHCHTHQYNKRSKDAAALDFKSERPVDFPTVTNSLHSSQKSACNMLQKILQRKKATALSQSADLLNIASSQHAPVGESKEAGLDDVFGYRGTESIFKSDIRWTLEDDQSLSKLFQHLLKHLVGVWVEYLGDHAEKKYIQSSKELETIKHILCIIYKVLYAYEQISEVDNLLKDLLKALPYLSQQIPLVMSSTHTSSQLNATNAYLVGVFSFVIGQEGTEPAVRALSDMLSRDDIDVSAVEFGILIGAFHRCKDKLPKKVYPVVWKNMMQTVLFGREKQNLSMQYFARDCEFVIDDDVLSWARELSAVMARDPIMCGHILDVMLMLSKKSDFKSSLQSTIQPNLIKLFYNASANQFGPFIKLQKQDQIKALQLLSQMESITQETSKALSKVCCDKKVVNMEIIIHTIELLRFHYRSRRNVQDSTASQLSFLITVLCSHREKVLPDVLVSLRTLRCSLEMLWSILKVMFSGKLMDKTKTVLLRLVCVTMEWSTHQESVKQLEQALVNHLRYAITNVDVAALDVVDDLLNVDTGLMNGLITNMMSGDQDKSFVVDALMHFVQSNKINGELVDQNKKNILGAVQALRSSSMEEWKLRTIEQRLL